MIDLHTHSSMSDGVLSPSELVKHAARNGVTVLALTDHDTIAGLAEAQEAASREGIRFVPGIELNIEWHTGEFHLLGLCLKSFSEQLLAIIDYLQGERKRRNREILRKMAEAGFSVCYEELERSVSMGLIGRPHIADYMVSKKFVRTRQQAFDKYLAKDRPLYDEIAGVPIENAVSAIKSSGGVSVVAHPLSLYAAWGKMEELFTDFYAKGIAGIEAWHPAARVGDCERLEALAQKTGLFVPAGSDFHGESVRSDRAIGHTAGGIAIEDRFLAGIASVSP
jgi:predicted metal-dependent phosphoesterase TrpH